MVIARQAVLLALDHSYSKPSQNTLFQWYILEELLITVAGPRRYYTELPY